MQVKFKRNTLKKINLEINEDHGGEKRSYAEKDVEVVKTISFGKHKFSDNKAIVRMLTELRFPEPTKGGTIVFESIFEITCDGAVDFPLISASEFTERLEAMVWPTQANFANALIRDFDISVNTGLPTEATFHA